jgi:hypothetical protein
LVHLEVLEFEMVDERMDRATSELAEQLNRFEELGLEVDLCGAGLTYDAKTDCY